MKISFTEKWKTMLKNPVLGGITIIGMASSIISRLIKDNSYYIIALVILFGFYLTISAVIALFFPVGKSIGEQAWDAYERAKYRKAKKLIDKARKKEKNAPLRFLDMIEGKVYQAADMKVDAIEAYERALDCDVDWWHFEACFQLGQIHEDSAHVYLSKAIDAYSKAIDVGETMLEIDKIDKDDEMIKQAKAHKMMPDEWSLINLCRLIAEFYEERNETGDDETARTWLQKEMALRDDLLPTEVAIAAQEAMDLGSSLILKFTADLSFQNHQKAIEQYNLAFEALTPYLGQLHPRMAEINLRLAETYLVLYTLMSKGFHYNDGGYCQDRDGSITRYNENSVEADDFVLALHEGMISHYKLTYYAYKRVIGDDKKTALSCCTYADYVINYAMALDQRELLLEAETEIKYAMQMCQKLNIDYVTALTQKTYGRICVLLQKDVCAIPVLEEAIAFFKTTAEYKDSLLECLFALGGACGFCELYHKAAEHYFQAMCLCETEGQKNSAKQVMQMCYEHSEQNRTIPFEDWFAQSCKAAGRCQRCGGTLESLGKACKECDHKN